MKLTEDQDLAINKAIDGYFKRDPAIMQEYQTYWRLLELNRRLTDYEEVVKQRVFTMLDLFYEEYNVPEEKKAHTKVKEFMKTGLSQEDAVAQVVKIYDESSHGSEDDE